MSLGDRLRGLLGGASRPVRVHVIVSGRIGAGWQDIDRVFALREGATLAALLDEADRSGIDLRALIAASPHLEHTLMLNGERCPLATNLERPLSDGDQVYLLAPIAGG